MLVRAPAAVAKPCGPPRGLPHPDVAGIGGHRTLLAYCWVAAVAGGWWRPVSRPRCPAGGTGPGALALPFRGRWPGTPAPRRAANRPILGNDLSSARTATLLP